MKLLFLHPSWLWLLLVLGAGILFALLRLGSTSTRRALTLHALAALSLILAAAGLSFRSTARRIQLVVAADISDSVYELNAQTARVRELLAALDPETTDAAVVVFGETAGLERSISPLPAPDVSRTDFPVRSIPGIPRLPDLEHPSAVVKTNGSDYAGALQFVRDAFTSADVSRAILLIGDFRDTRAPHNQNALKGASFLSGSGIELLVTPAVLGASSDVQLSELRAPDTASAERAIPLEITVAAQRPVSVVVKVHRAAAGRPNAFVDAKTIQLEAAPDAAPGMELRKTIRILDQHSKTPGVVIYTATLSAPDGAAIQGDVSTNNTLSAAVRVLGPSRWAVLARSNSTLARLALDPAKPLGADTVLFAANNLPAEESKYEPFAGVLVDAFSAEELSESGAALLALSRAVERGKALVAVGGTAAFGAGGHAPGGTWEKVLPIEMTPEDDRARAVLFLIDVSKSMNDRISRGGAEVRKMDFAAEQLQVVRQLRPQDRLGLIEFSGEAKLSAPLSNEPARARFFDAVRAIRIESSTDIHAALKLAKEVLDKDNAEKKLVILISDGIQTGTHTAEETIRAAEELCPKRAGVPGDTTLFTFGIGVDSQPAANAGERLLQNLAHAGGGEYSGDFRKLGKVIADILDRDKKEFYTRTDEFSVQATRPHPLLAELTAWPRLSFRNRVKAKADAETILLSAPTVAGADIPAKKARDPLLVLSGPASAALARRAALAVSLDGAEGEKLLVPGSAGRSLLSNLLTWAEGRADSGAAGTTLIAEPSGNDELAVELRVFDPKTGEPRNDLEPLAALTVLETGAAASRTDDKPLETPLRASAPGTYRGVLRAPPASVCRLSVQNGAQALAERFISTPCAAELRRFGVDRAAMAELVAKAGPGSRAIESPRDLAQWAAQKTGASSVYDLRPWLVALALVLLLSEYAFRKSG